mmetsp:Transcript_105214/g.166095  ORF Transcript_105214/g.166095 Transcript_105214/m.166095 type:complete len:93 (-) Transcript_105214:836-1114(-)
MTQLKRAPRTPPRKASRRRLDAPLTNEAREQKGLALGVQLFPNAKERRAPTESALEDAVVAVARRLVGHGDLDLNRKKASGVAVVCSRMRAC